MGNQRNHSSLADAKSSSSATINVALTAFCKLLPAASKIAEILRRHWATCACTDPSTILPVAGSMGAVPETKINPAALTAWL